MGKSCPSVSPSRPLPAPRNSSAAASASPSSRLHATPVVFVRLPQASLNASFCGRCFWCFCPQPADQAVAVPALPPLSQARQHVGNLSHHHPDLPAPPSVSSIPSREPSVTRGRAPTTSSQRGPPSRSQTPVVAISRERPSPDAGVERKLERKPSQSYGHHRNTSIVHGIQHSRNTSFVNSPATSPLSPQIIAAVGGAGPNGLDGPFMMPQDELADLPANISPSATNGGGRYGTGPPSVSGDYRAYNEAAAQQFRGDPRRLERTDSVRMKHTHVRSQSRHHHGRTVGELALHHLFNAVGAPA